MSISAVRLRDRREELGLQARRIAADLNAINGALQVLDELITEAEAEPEQPPDRVEDPGKTT